MAEAARPVVSTPVTTPDLGGGDDDGSAAAADAGADLPPAPGKAPTEPLVKGAWTPEEDKRLAELQAKLGNRWSVVAAYLNGRTGQQCAQRWRHKVNPSIRKEKWTEEEDLALAKLYDVHGQKWAEIARHMAGRTDQQCMGRWRRHLDPSIKREAWAAEEDARLKALYEEMSSAWSAISKRLVGRTAQQCRARWFQLQTHEANMKAAEKKKEVKAAGTPAKAAKAAAAAAGSARGAGTPTPIKVPKARPSSPISEGDDDDTPPAVIAPDEDDVAPELDGVLGHAASGQGKRKRSLKVELPGGAEEEDPLIARMAETSTRSEGVLLPEGQPSASGLDSVAAAWRLTPMGEQVLPSPNFAWPGCGPVDPGKVDVRQVASVVPLASPTGSIPPDLLSPTSLSFSPTEWADVAGEDANENFEPRPGKRARTVRTRASPRTEPEFAAHMFDHISPR